MYRLNNDDGGQVELTDRSFVYLDQHGAIHVRMDKAQTDFTFRLAARVRDEGATTYSWVEKSITVGVQMPPCDVELQDDAALERVIKFNQAIDPIPLAQFFSNPAHEDVDATYTDA